MHLVRDGTLKWALRGAFADELPMNIVERRKHGFNVPLEHWYRTDWKDLFFGDVFGRIEFKEAGNYRWEVQ